MTLEEFRKKAQNDEWTPGWDAIDEAFEKVYSGGEKIDHYATLITTRAIFGGTEYLDGYSLYKSEKGYIHIVTYGMSELYANENAFGKVFNGWGYEMTMKLPETEPTNCLWACNMLGNLARYTYRNKLWFEPWDFISNVGEPIKDGSDTLLTAVMAVPDTEVAGVDTIYGRLDFLQFVGITTAEYEMLKAEPSKAVLLAEAMKRDGNPDLITDLSRTKSYLEL